MNWNANICVPPKVSHEVGGAVVARDDAVFAKHLERDAIEGRHVWHADAAEALDSRERPAVKRQPSSRSMIPSPSMSLKALSTGTTNAPA
jgi:hypothetical protein